MPALLLLSLLLTVSLVAEEPLAPVANGPAYGSQSVLAIGTNANGEAFVVWQDIREGGYARINGSRVSDAGELRDPLGIPIAPMTGLPWTVRVSRTSHGSGWQVELDTTAHGTRVRYTVEANGTVSGPAVIPVPSPFLHQLLGGGPQLRASNGSETLIVGRREHHPAAQIVTVRLDARGMAIGEPVLFAPHAVYRGTLLDLAWSGTDYVLLYRENRTLYAQRIGANGAPSGDPIRLGTDVLSATASPLTTSGDGSVVLLYQDASERIRIVRLRGTTVEAVTTDIRSAGAAITTIGQNAYMLAWNTATGIVVEPVANDLVLRNVATVEETITPNAQKNFNSDRTQEARLLVWEERDGIRGRIMARRPEGGEKFALWPSANDQKFPAVARLGDSHFVVWYEENTLRGMLFDYFGDPLLFEPLTLPRIKVTLTPPPPVQPVNAPPAVVWTGHYLLVAWNAGDELRVARVTAGGVVVSDEAISERVTMAEIRPVLVRAGSIVWLVYQAGEGEAPCVIFHCLGSPARIHAIRFGLGGQRIDRDPIVIAGDKTGERLHARPDAAWNGRMLLVTWISHGTLYARELDLHGNLYDVRAVANNATSGSVIAFGEEFVIVPDAKLWRAASGIAIARERIIDGIPRIYVSFGVR